MAIKEQCNNCKKYESCGEPIVFNSESCSAYVKKGIDLEKHTEENPNLSESKIEENTTSTSVSAQDDIEDFVYTREYLKENTKIHGWLFFFCLTIFFGGLFSAIYPLVTFDINDYGGSYVLGMVDVILGLMLLVLAIFTNAALCRRDTDAIFLAKTYIIACFVGNFIGFISGNYEPSGVGSISQIGRRLIWGVIWFLYLLNSSQVEEVIPSEYRKTKSRDWYILGGLILPPLFFLACGILDVNKISEREATKFIEQTALAKDEFTDGRIIFKKGEGFMCNDTIVEGSLRLFSLEDDTMGTTIILCSDYDSDQSNANLDSYWDNWEDEGAKSYPSSVVLDERRSINEHPYYYKVKEYDIDGNTVYWRFVLLFDDSSGKVCLVSAYDEGNAEYLQTLLKSIRFE